VRAILKKGEAIIGGIAVDGAGPSADTLGPHFRWYFLNPIAFNKGVSHRIVTMSAARNGIAFALLRPNVCCRVPVLLPLRLPMSLITQILCLCMTASSGPHPQLSQQWGTIRYKHEFLGTRTHLLRLNIEYFFVDSDEDRLRHMKSFVEYFASQTCPSGFTRIDSARRPSWPKLHIKLSEQFVFHCK